jgi:quercetin dioxygenase-like cupin family protein
MQKSLTVLGIMIVALVAWSRIAPAQDKPASGRTVIFSAADDLKYKEVVPGVSRAVLWGNPEQREYGAFTKFAPGLDAGMHTHTNDIWLVVLRGAYLYRDDRGAKRVGPAGFIRIPGKTKHWSGGDPKEGALFYEESAGKFDLTPAK